MPFLLLLLLALELARITWYVLPAPHPATGVNPAATLSGAHSAVEMRDVKEITAPSLHRVVMSLRRFNPWEEPEKKQKMLPIKPPPEPEEKVVVTQLDLELVGTMILPDDASWAVLVRRSNREKQISLRIGESLDGAVLERMERKSVYLRNKGRLEKLSMLGSEDEKNKTKKKTSSQEKSVGKTISRSVYDTLLGKGMGLMAGVNITPFYQGRKSTGYRLKFSGSNADMSQFGLKNGDVIQQVNGIQVTDQKKITLFSRELKKQSSLSISVLRNNQPETIQLQIGR